MQKMKAVGSKRNTFARLFGFMFRHYPVKLIVCFICIIFSSTSSVIASTFMRRLISSDCK